MFYFFHHVPKCGGTSFKTFLNRTFTLHNDYSYKGRQIDIKNKPDEFERYKAESLDLESFGPNDCIAGHFNLPGIFVWERYPDLFSRKAKVFTIIRDPFEAAKSGVRFGVKRNKLPEARNREENTKFLLRRANMFATTLGIRDLDDIDPVLDRYWLVAPLERAQEMADVIAGEVGVAANPLEHLNTTAENAQSDSDAFLPNAEAQFRNAARLDMAIYQYAIYRASLPSFGRLEHFRSVGEKHL